MKNTLTAIVMVISSICFTQNKIVLIDPIINNLYVTPKTAAKLLSIELNKLDRYIVLDEFYLNSINIDKESKCNSMECITSYGKQTKADYVIVSTLDGLGKKLLIDLKIIDVNKAEVVKSNMQEFFNDEIELQNMYAMMLSDFFERPFPKVLREKITYSQDLSNQTGVNKINNAGPRFGFGLPMGDYKEFVTRSEKMGGLDAVPFFSSIGYQFEGQYVGTKDFSGLLELVINLHGLEQGFFSPAFTLLNGFRFGSKAWEIGFGPSFSFRKMANAFKDTENLFGKGAGTYFTSSDWSDYTHEEYDKGNAMFTDPNWGGYQYVEPNVFNSNYTYDYNIMHTEGGLKIIPSWVFAFGRTFHYGAINLPVNVFYSMYKRNIFTGISVGFNIQKGK